MDYLQEGAALKRKGIPQRLLILMIIQATTEILNYIMENYKINFELSRKNVNREKHLWYNQYQGKYIRKWRLNVYLQQGRYI